MSNKAAEQLRAFMLDGTDYPIDAALLDEALAAERKATVERIGKAIRAKAHLFEGVVSTADVAAILDAEVAREGVQ